MLTLRVDDRLIHTQVVIGWIQALALTRVIVADDTAASDPMQILALEVALPPGIACCVCPEDEIAHQLYPEARQMIIVASLASASRVIAHVPAITEINLANCSQHRHSHQYQQVAASVWLTQEERDLLSELTRQGINIVYHPVPPVNEK